jgi:hypothetical protein
MQAEVSQGSVLSPTLYNLYINNSPQTSGVNLALSADDAWLYATDRKEGYVLRKIQCGLNSMAACVKAGILKSMKTRLKRSTSLIEIDRPNLFLRWMDGISHL